MAGLVGLAIFIALITNAIRRRRALKFDEDVAKAAAEAARSPVALDDYDDVFGRYGSNGSAGGAGYSDGSHGTYNQPPMTHHNTYGMSELGGGVGVHHPHSYDAYTAGATSGAAGVGSVVSRGKSLRGLRQSYEPHQEPRANMSPYPAYPQGPQQEMYDVSGAGAAAFGTHAASLRNDPQRNKSLGGQSPGGPDSYLPNPHRGSQDSQGEYQGRYGSSHYQGGYQPEDNQSYPAPVVEPAQRTIPAASVDPYGGYIDSPNQPTQSRHSELLSSGRNTYIASPPGLSNGELKDDDRPVRPGHLGEEDHARASFRDEEDYELERSNRVLKVANQ